VHVTAINVLLEADRVHFFSDGGHFAGTQLCHLGGKVFPLPAYDAAMAYSGPSAAAPTLLAEIERSDAASLANLLNRLPGLVAAANRKAAVGRQPFSAVVAGVHGGIACGLAVEEGDTHHFLAPGSFIRSLPSDVAFVLTNLEASGLAMMEDQRRHGVVAGFCQHSVVGHDAFHSRILRRWPDIASGAGSTVQAKIGDLEVDTINFAGSSVTGAVSGATSITVPNTAGFPVIFSAFCNWTYRGDTTNSAGTVTLLIRRQSDSKLIATNTTGRAGLSALVGPFGFSIGGIDDDAPAGNVVYTLSATGAGSGGPPPGQVNVSGARLTGVYAKK
jgi:hypothetical protein